MRRPFERMAAATLIAIASTASSAQLPLVPAATNGTARPATVIATSVRSDSDELSSQLLALTSALRSLGADGFGRADATGSPIVFRIDDDTTGRSPEAYRITTRRQQLLVTACSAIGAARAAATLLQTVEIEGGAAVWPQLTIDDAPDLPFRCFMVDIGRNPHGPEVLRRIVDACWFYKVNHLQLHLTDDQLFSWPSRAFPKLFDERSGWSWDAFVALEAYARARGVAIIPEIDVPGHSTILRSRYPEVFGKTPTELATLPSATTGMQRLLDELLEVFASTRYVHLGGDEAYGVPGDAQRDFLNRLNRYVKGKGRRSLAWEGPALGDGEHKVDTDVLHVNWRTIEFPAQQMLDAGYQVVNAAWDPMYVVDHYPRTMFTAVPLQHCYRWQPRRFAHVDPGMPTFREPHVTDTADGIVGFMMPWWEGRQENVVKLCVPRLAAVAAAAWNRDGERDFASFERRQHRLLRRYRQLSGADLGETPFADPATQHDNLAYRAQVTVSAGASQPVFGPDRLTNGIPDRFDHFLGYPTQPEPLVITIELVAAAELARVVVHERAVGGSHEVYELQASADGDEWTDIGRSGQGTRGEAAFVEHRFPARTVRWLRIVTRGCHGLTFPSFSRLCEVEAFAR